MIETGAGATFTAYADNFDAGRLAEVGFRIEDKAGATVVARTAADAEPDPGVYACDLVAPSPAERTRYLIIVDDPARNLKAVEELEVRGVGEPATPPAGPSYAEVADLRAESAVPDGAPPTDAELAALLVEAEDRVDRLVGPRGVLPATGRKYDVSAGGGLTIARRLALKRSTLVLAVAAYLEPDAFLPPAGERIKGPDFEVQTPAGATPAAQAALTRVVGILDANGLRVLTATVR